MHGKSFILRLKLFKPELDHLATHPNASVRKTKLVAFICSETRSKICFPPYDKRSVSFCQFLSDSASCTGATTSCCRQVAPSPVDEF